MDMNTIETGLYTAKVDTERAHKQVSDEIKRLLAMQGDPKYMVSRVEIGELRRLQMALTTLHGQVEHTKTMIEVMKAKRS